MSTDKVKIACRIPNGIELRLFKKGEDDGTGTGYHPMVQDGPGVFVEGPRHVGAGAHNTTLSNLPPSITEIDAAYWQAWRKQNENNPSFLKGLVEEHREEGKSDVVPAAGSK